MKKIELTRGCNVLVDDEDYEYLMQWKWCVHASRGYTFYAKRGDYSSGRHKTIFMHRVIMKSDSKIDHIDGNGLNCQKINMRVTNNSLNQANRHNRGKHTSKYKGVHFDSNSLKWRSEIGKEKSTRKYLGRFPKTACGELLAAITYDKAAVEMYGEHANLNFPIPSREVT